MSTASTIIDLFGGTRPCAAALGLPVSTVQSWKTNGRIPAGRQQLVLDKARELGIPVTPASFFENGDDAHSAADNSMSEKFVQAGGGNARPITNGAARVAASDAG